MSYQTAGIVQIKMDDFWFFVNANTNLDHDNEYVKSIFLNEDRTELNIVIHDYGIDFLSLLYNRTERISMLDYYIWVSTFLPNDAEHYVGVPNINGNFLLMHVHIWTTEEPDKTAYNNINREWMLLSKGEKKIY